MPARALAQPAPFSADAALGDRAFSPRARLTSPARLDLIAAPGTAAPSPHWRCWSGAALWCGGAPAEIAANGTTATTVRGGPCGVSAIHTGTTRAQHDVNSGAEGHGDGGFVEFSTRDTVEAHGRLHASAALQGRGGTICIDPST